MFYVYETSLKLLANGTFATSETMKEIFLSFCAWASLKMIPFESLSKSREDYFCDIYSGTGDALQRLLSIDDDITKEEAIRFLFLNETFWSSFENLNGPVYEENIREKEAATKLENPILLSRLIGIETNDLPIHVHISFIEKKQIRMHYFRNAGIFLCIGEEVDLSSYSNYSQDNFVAVFKALGDNSRIEIMKALLKKSQTTSQLSEKVNLSLSTVNHHLKQMIDAGIVSLELSSKAGKGASYKCNKSVLNKLLDMLRWHISSNDSTEV